MTTTDKIWWCDVGIAAMLFVSLCCFVVVNEGMSSALMGVLLGFKLRQVVEGMEDND